MQQPDGYRYERKFLLTGVEAPQVQMILRQHWAMFHETYPPRYVNNIYMDTPEFDNYGDNLAGAADRTKVRIRWYHDLFRWVDDGVLEFKVKNGLVGWKDQFDFPTFDFSSGFSPRDFQRLIQDSDLLPHVKLRLSGYRPSVVNRYLRSYFATKDERFRATIDTKLSYYKVNRLSNRFIVQHKEHRTVIVEIKYDREHEDEVNRIASSLPFRLSRSSKYVQGIEAFHLW
jgi:SPX domain protein involved in polyphosphate accumulation